MIKCSIKQLPQLWPVHIIDLALSLIFVLCVLNVEQSVVVNA